MSLTCIEPVEALLVAFNLSFCFIPKVCLTYSSLGSNSSWEGTLDT